MSSKKQKSKFPAGLFITRLVDSDDEVYFVASETPEQAYDAAEGQVEIAFYTWDYDALVTRNTEVKAK